MVQEKDPKRWDEVIIDSPFAKLTKRDVHEYYSTPAVQKKILGAVGDREAILRQSFTADKTVLRRKDEAGELIRLNKEQLDKWNAKRLSEVHPTFGRKTDVLLADIDPQEGVDWHHTKKITETVAKTMQSRPEVRDVSIRYSGGRGFYVEGKLDAPVGVDHARNLTKQILDGLAQRHDVFFEPVGPGKIRLDTTPLKNRGSIRAPYSINADTGLVSAPVKLEDLAGAQKKDFSVARVLERMQEKKAAELEKEARLSFSKLRALLHDEPALFHMVNPENAESFLRLGGEHGYREVYSPIEARLRGLISSVESGWSTGRRTVQNTIPQLPVNLGENAARMDARVFTENRMAPAIGLASLSSPGVIGRYHQLSELASRSGEMKSGKNWSSISFSPKPNRTYGDVGLLTTPSNVRGELTGLGVGATPLEEVSEFQAYPKWSRRKDIVHHATLPRAKGLVVYDPHRVSREQARALKAQGAIALNSRADRLLKAYQKKYLKNMPASTMEDIGKGMVPHGEIPGFERLKQRAITRVPEYVSYEAIFEKELREREAEAARAVAAPKSAPAPKVAPVARAVAAPKSAPTPSKPKLQQEDGAGSIWPWAAGAGILGGGGYALYKTKSDTGHRKAASSSLPQSLLDEVSKDKWATRAYGQKTLREIKEGKRDVVPIEDKGNIVGFMAPNETKFGYPSTGFVFVSPPSRGKGLAAKVLAEYAKKNPSAISFLHRDNIASQKAHLKAGWEDTGAAARGNPRARVWRVKQAAATLKTELLPHQQRVVDRMATQPGLVVAHGTGSGKTLSSLAALVQENQPSLVLVPAALVSNYKKEQAKHVRGRLPATIDSQQRAVRTGSLPATHMLVVDEAHRARNESAFQDLLQNAQAEKRLLLTASPVYNSPSDIAPLVNIAAGERVLPTGRDFDTRFVEKPSRGWGSLIRAWMGGETEARLKNTPKLQKVLNNWVDYHANVGGEFPRSSTEHFQLAMTPRQTELHNLAWGKLPLMARLRLAASLPPDKKDLAAINAFQSQARQVSGSDRKFLTGAQIAEPAPKILDAVKKLKSQLGKDDTYKALVYSNYLATLGDYATQLEKEKIPFGVFTGEQSTKERDALVKNYNAGDLKALLVSSAGGEGLDLKGTRAVQVLEPHWNEEKLQQVIGRAIRHQSHADLPEDKRHVAIQRFESYPKPGFFRSLVGSKPTGVEQVLSRMSENKQRLNTELLGLLKQSAARRKEFAPGIPANRKIHRIPKVKNPQPWTLAIQKHDANKAGTHFDLRLIPPKGNKAHSWAIPKAKLPKRGVMQLAIQQPTHTKEYATTFSGKIPKGTYGAGKVTMHTNEPVTVLSAGDNRVKFRRASGEQFTLFRTREKQWGITKTAAEVIDEWRKKKREAKVTAFIRERMR